MGITIAYRGRLADITRVEDFEDRLLDFALEVGGQATVWRTQSDSDPERMIRGIILNVAPGLESTSMLISPEGWLVGLTEIEDAENGKLTELPWCFTKTQFGPIEGHVAIVELLTELEREFLADVEISDDGGYYPARDLAELKRRKSLTNDAIDGLAEGLSRHGLSREAAEDPDILERRIQRIAGQVQRILRRPAEHPPVSFPDEDEGGDPPTPESTELLWDELFKQNRRQQEQLCRAIEERSGRDETAEEAFEKAMEDIGIEPPDEESEEADEADEAWDEGPNPFDESVKENEDAEEESEAFDFERNRSPLLELATGLLTDLHSVFRDTEPQYASALHTLFQGAGDVMGGLAQALSGRDEEDLDDYGLRVTQLKRALRGAAFARGALFPLRDATTAEQFEELHGRLEQMDQDIFNELSRLRGEYQN